MTHSSTRNDRFTAAIVLLGMLGGTNFLAAHPRLSHGHADVGIGYADGSWDFHVHDEEADIEYEPGQVVLVVPAGALVRIPDDPRHAFLGKAGGWVWVLPEAQPDGHHHHDEEEDPNDEDPHDDHGLLFLGLSAGDIEAGVFENDRITLSLVRVEGPGDFFLYHTDPFGNPVMGMNSADGIDEADAIELLAGSHRHVNWAFNQPGEYRLGFEASGTLAGGATVRSAVAEFVFEVQPAPMLQVERKADGMVALSWFALAGHEYHLQATGDLATAGWQDVPGVAPIEGEGAMVSVEVALEAGMRFFRLEIHEEDDHDPHHHD